MAHMDVAIGVGRAIVEDELLTTVARGAEFAVKVFGCPSGKDRGLLLRETGLHREVGLGQEDGVAPVLLGCVGLVGHGGRLLAHYVI